jgi:hypothetical protein
MAGLGRTRGSFVFALGSGAFIGTKTEKFR